MPLSVRWTNLFISSVPCLTRVRLCDPMDCSTPGLPVHHQFPEFAQTHVHWVNDAIQPSHPLSSPSSPALDLSQHQGLFQWLSSSYQVAKVLEFQLQHQSFQGIFRVDFLPYKYLDIYIATHTYIHATGYYSSIKKEWNHAICSNMDGSRYMYICSIYIHIYVYVYIYTQRKRESTWNHTQYFVINYEGKESEEETPNHWCIPVCVLVDQSCPTLCDSMDSSPPHSFYMEFSRQEYWSGLQFLSPGIFPSQGSKQGLLHCRQISLSSELTGKYTNVGLWKDPEPEDLLVLDLQITLFCDLFKTSLVSRGSVYSFVK